MSLALLGLPKSWHSYQDSVNEREKLPNWECLWYDLVQEEIRQNTKDGTSSKEEEEDFSLVNKGMKAKGKKTQGEVESSQEGKKKYLSKIKCFNCHEFRHYATKCAHKKYNKKTNRGATCETLAP